MSLEQRVRSTLKDAGTRIDTTADPEPFTVVSQERRSRYRPPMAFVVGFAAVLVFGGVGILFSGEGSDPAGDAQPTFSDLLGSIADQLPDGFDPDQAEPLFTFEGEPEEVAAQYLEARIPTIGAGITRVEAQGGFTLVQWAWGRLLNPDDVQSERGEKGWLVLRPLPRGYEVVAATTDGVDLSDLTLRDGAVRGVVASNTDEFIGADLLRQDGTPIESAPYPEGFFPDAETLWGTAGADSPPLALDVPVSGQVAIRVSRVGGALLSITEVIIGSVPEAQTGDISGVWQLDRYTIEGQSHDVIPDVNVVNEPWVTIDEDSMTGNAGCNAFQGPYGYEGGVLTSELFRNAAWCGPEDGTLMEAELAFEHVVRPNEPVAVTFAADRMIWSNGDNTLEFVSVETPPTTQPVDALNLSEVTWVTHGPDGIRLDDGTLIWKTQPFPADVARDRQGGLVFSDSTGLWWFQAGNVKPTLVGEGGRALVTVIATPSGPVAMTLGDPSFYGLSDGEPAEAPAEVPVEVMSDTPWLWKWTASNGLTAWVTDPEVATNQEGQPVEILEPAHLIVAEGDEVVVDVRIGNFDDAWVRMHDFDGRQLILSRGPFEPAMPEETFLLVDLATGDVAEAFVAAGVRATFTSADTDWFGPVQSPDLG